MTQLNYLKELILVKAQLNSRWMNIEKIHLEFKFPNRILQKLPRLLFRRSAHVNEEKRKLVSRHILKIFETLCYKI